MNKDIVKKDNNKEADRQERPFISARTFIKCASMDPEMIYPCMVHTLMYRGKGKQCTETLYRVDKSSDFEEVLYGISALDSIRHTVLADGIFYIDVICNSVKEVPKESEEKAGVFYRKVIQWA